MLFPNDIQPGLQALGEGPSIRFLIWVFRKQNQPGSSNPNREVWIEGRKIFIHSLKDIGEGDELTFDCGLDTDYFEDHPRRCGQGSEGAQEEGEGGDVNRVGIVHLRNGLSH